VTVWLCLAAGTVVLLFAWSLSMPALLGAYRPVALLGALLLVYDVLPFVLVGLFTDRADALLGGMVEHYAIDRTVPIVALVVAMLAAACLGQAAVTRSQSFGTGRAPVLRPLPSCEESNRLSGVLFFWPLAFVAVILVVQLRGFLFGGYHETLGDDTTEIVRRGALSSVFVLMLVAHLFAWTPRELPARRHPQQLASVLVLAAIGLALLSMGGRLYVVSALLLVGMLWLSRRPRGRRVASARRTAGVVALALGGIALVGIWRSSGDLSPESVLVNLLAEPGFVSISLASLFSQNEVPALSWPVHLLGDVVGVLPASVYPDKLDRLFSIRDAFDVASPFGGLNGLTSLVANVGWAGAIAVSGLLGALATAATGWAARSPASARRRLLVVVATALPALSLHRDPFVISVYKNFLQNAVVFPLVLVVASHLLAPLAVRARVTARLQPGGASA
jgi:hypothetical protein